MLCWSYVACYVTTPRLVRGEVSLFAVAEFTRINHHYPQQTHRKDNWPQEWHYGPHQQLLMVWGVPTCAYDIHHTVMCAHKTLWRVAHRTECLIRVRLAPRCELCTDARFSSRHVPCPHCGVGTKRKQKDRRTVVRYARVPRLKQ